MFPLFRQHAQPVVGEEVLQQRGVIAAGFDGRIELWVVLHAGDAAAERVAPVEVAAERERPVDAEVDQMVLDFPVMADYATLFDEAGRELFLTHGHVFGAGMHNSVDHAPALPEGSALVYGHTHIKVNEESAAHPGLWLFNPGSVSIPKDGTHSYGIYEGDAFRHVIMEED